MMSRQIWKYPLHPNKIQTIKIPDSAEALGVFLHKEVPFLYMEILETDAPKRDRQVQFFATGEDIPPNWNYVGMFMHDLPGKGLTVYHVCERLCF